MALRTRLSCPSDNFISLSECCLDLNLENPCTASFLTPQNGSDSMDSRIAFSTLRLPFLFFSTFIAAILSRICGPFSNCRIHSDNGLLNVTLQGILIPALKMTILGLTSTGSS